MSTFTAIDVETANADLATICQIGIVRVVDDRIESVWSSIVNPEDWFDPRNVSIHGIAEQDAMSCPTLLDVADDLYDQCGGSVLISHTAFDRTALTRSFERYDLPPLDATWLDSARIARRAWPELKGSGGYGLSALAETLGISFSHHDALEDARAAAMVVLRACKETGQSVSDWLEEFLSPTSYSSGVATREVNVDGLLFGETVVFTGALSVSREEAARLAASAGCAVLPNVTKKVTMLVVGTQNRQALRGYEKSSKHRKAESLIEQGLEIQILTEADFRALVEF